MSQTDHVFSQSSPAFCKIGPFGARIRHTCRHPRDLGPASCQRAVSPLFIATSFTSLTIRGAVAGESDPTHPRRIIPWGAAACRRLNGCLSLLTCGFAWSVTRCCSATINARTTRLVPTDSPILPLHVGTTPTTMDRPSSPAAAGRRTHPRAYPDGGKCFPS